jgi:HD-GYP domain-containing protein (c-di-GMP phosphodiesterase class II)
LELARIMLKKIRVFDLQTGMYVVDTGLSWLDHPYLYCTEGLIESEDQIRSIRAEGYSETFIETDKDKLRCDTVRVYGVDEVEQAVADALLGGLNQCKSNKKASLADEMARAEAIQARAAEAVREAMDAAASGGTLDGPACAGAAGDIAASVARNRDALVCMSLLTDDDAYHIRHCASVSVFAAALGESMGFSPEHVSALALAGLLHDVGMAFIPREIKLKQGRLTPEEFLEIKTHCQRGHALLAGQAGFAPEALRAVAEHHERLDGSGYPQGLKGREISVFGRILSVADVFDALTKDRPYKTRVMPDKALGAMYGMRGRDFDQGILERFIKCVGVYPPGSLVRLSTGEYAVVSQSNPSTPLRPKVAVVLDQDMRPIHPVQMDLSGREGPAPAKAMDVSRVVDHRPHGFRAGEHLS